MEANKLIVAMTVYHSTTPGPWGVYRGRSAFAGELVALFNTEEDARAFAAAHDLLEALKDCLDRLEQDYPSDNQRIVNARAAIAKAKG